MRFLIITNVARQKMTGGHIVDEYFYNRFRDNGHEVIYSSDFMPRHLNRYLMIDLLGRVKEFSQYDQIYINAYLCHVVIAFMILYRLWNRTNNMTVIIHHFRYMQMKGVKSLWFWLIERLMLRLSNKTIVVSPYIEELVKKILPEKKIEYIGIPFTKPIKSEVHHYKYGNLLYVGTVEPRKGLSYLIDAISLLPVELRKKVSLDVVGKEDIVYADKVRKQIHKLALTNCIHFRGRVSNEELDSYYERAMIFTFPSLLEGFGMVIMEAMGHSVPVICFNNSAMPYTVKDSYNGCVVSNKNAIAFKDALVKVLSNQKYYLKLCMGAEETALNVQTHEQFNRLVDTYLHKM